MADYKPGNMDIREQERTFASFLRFTQWVVGIVLVVLVFLALANA